MSIFNLQSELYLLSFFLVFICCETKKSFTNKETYQGPLSSLDSVNTLLSDSGKLVLHIVAAKQNNYENSDKEWPSHFLIEFFDRKGSITNVFSADCVYYDHSENTYFATGNVEVENLVNKDKLNTEELLWDRNIQEFYTDKYITIHSENEIHTGDGLRAKQDFSSYRILKPRGTFDFEEDATHLPQQH